MARDSFRHGIMGSQKLLAPSQGPCRKETDVCMRVGPVPAPSGAQKAWEWDEQSATGTQCHQTSGNDVGSTKPAEIPLCLRIFIQLSKDVLATC